MNIGALAGGFGIFGAPAIQSGKAVLNPGESTEVQSGKRVSPAECETCKNRKYKDGSDESDVSFQTAQHIDPGEAASKVRAHEQEHVANAYEKEAKGEGKVLQASVQIKMSVCPECGRSFVCGGLTTTRIAYPNEKQPYMKGMKAAHAANGAVGGNLDLAC